MSNTPRLIDAAGLKADFNNLHQIYLAMLAKKDPKLADKVKAADERTKKETHQVDAMGGG